MNRTRDALPRILLSIVCGLIVTIYCDLAEVRAEGPDQDAKKKAEALIKGILKERTKIVSGLVHIEGDKTAESDTPKYKTDIQARMVFDFADESVRYDHDSPGYVGGSIWMRSLRYIQQPKYRASWSHSLPNSSSGLIVDDPKARKGAGTAGHHLFDLRAAGVINCDQFQASDFESGERVSDYCERLLKAEVKSVEEEHGVSVLSLQTEHTDMTLKVVHKGFCPVEYVVKSRTAPLVQKSRVDWEQKNGVWVPRYVWIEREFPPDEVLQKYLLRFKWETVNGPVDPWLFDYRSFTGIRDGTRVMDHRGPMPLEVGRWKNFGRILPPPREPDPPRAEHATTRAD